MITISKNSNDNYDVFSDDDILGEIIIDSFAGEPMFEQMSSELLDMSDLHQIIEIMNVLSEQA